jgi:NAD+ kinase
MRFIIRSKEGYGEGVKRDVIGILRESGAQVTERFEKGCDFAIVIGGDGTLLRDQPELECPVLGINPGGSVGFYMTASRKDYRKRVKALLSGNEGKDYFIHRLMRLEATVNGRRVPGLALNDALVAPTHLRWILESSLTVDGNGSRERNSGIIIYTPTGSNAFAHSAGAGKLEHDDKRMGVVAVAPYSGRLKGREILTRGGPVELRLTCDSGELSLDGSDDYLVRLKKGDTVIVKKSKRPLELVGFSKRL